MTDCDVKRKMLEHKYERHLLSQYGSRWSTKQRKEAHHALYRVAHRAVPCWLRDKEILLSHITYKFYQTRRYIVPGKNQDEIPQRNCLTVCYNAPLGRYVTYNFLHRKTLSFFFIRRFRCSIDYIYFEIRPSG